MRFSANKVTLKGGGVWRKQRTSLSKLALVNSSELSSALVAASFTLLLGSSFLMPWMMAVRIWLAFSCSCSGSCGKKPGERAFG